MRVKCARTAEGYKRSASLYEISSLPWATVRTRCLQTERLVLVSVQKRVLRGLGLSAMTVSGTTGIGGAEESWRAAAIGKYMPVLVSEFGVRVD